MNRPRAVAVVLAVMATAACALAWWWPTSAPALPCDPADVHLGPDGVARCADGAPLPAAQALTVGQRLDLNRASVDELAAIPGLGRSVAEALVKARAEQGGFSSWDQVDQAPGVGPSRLATLRKVSEIRGIDAGSW